MIHLPQTEGGERLLLTGQEEPSAESARAQRPPNRPQGHRAVVALLAEVRQDDRLERRRAEIGGEFGGQSVREVPHGTADALPDGRRIRSGLEHHLIMVGLEHQGVHPAQEVA